MKILPYKNGSVSAAALAVALNCKKIRNREDLPVFRGKGAIINWGCSAPKRRLAGQRIINPFESVAVAVDKLLTFQALKAANVPVPPFTQDIEEAKSFTEGSKRAVVRLNLRGYGGDGIHIIERSEDLIPAPLYVKYIPKSNEYRVHVVNGNVVFVQRKARKHDVPDEQVNWQVRNLAGGFIYANQNVELSDEGKDVAVRSVAALNLDFGAVDLIHSSSGEFYTLEVNTACGLAGTTVEKYAEAFGNME